MAGDKKYEYDAFLAYNTEDGEAIVDTIIAELEKLNMKCHTNADFELGEPIVESIGKAMTTSEKILLIVTKNFLTGKWTIFEIHQALAEVYSRRKTALIPILCGITPEELPKELKDIKAVAVDLDQNDPDFFPNLAKMIKEEPKSLGDTIPIPNVGYGLAWSYFYGYLKMILPGMEDRIVKSDFCTDPERKKTPFFKKFIIVLADNGYCPASLNDLNPNMKMAGRITFKANRAGQMQRDYSSTVWEISDPATKETFYVAVEFATPLMSLYEMSAGQIAGLSEEAKSYQIRLFESTVRQIINHPNSGCTNSVVFLNYDGPCRNPECKQDPGFAKLVIDVIRSYTVDSMDTS